jgi:hypothetical protein
MEHTQVIQMHNNNITRPHALVITGQRNQPLHSFFLASARAWPNSLSGRKEKSRIACCMHVCAVDPHDNLQALENENSQKSRLCNGPFPQRTQAPTHPSRPGGDARCRVLARSASARMECIPGRRIFHHIHTYPSHCITSHTTTNEHARRFRSHRSTSSL